MRTSFPLLLLIILLVATTRLAAQGSSSFCGNTALVPVFKQDFGSGANASATTTAPAGSTNYNFGWVGSDGNYIVTPRVENAGKSDWTKGGDHTGNPNGNMFLVNAGGNRSIFLQQTVSGLCPGSSYSFTAWLANVNTISTKSVCGSGLIYSKITFNIKDLANNLLATYTTDTLPLSPVNGPPNWKKYGFQFSLPANITSLKLEIVDYWGGGAACGNDVALDDILFEACVPQITVSLAGNASVCVGDSGKLQTTLINSPYLNPAYLWQKSKDGGTTWDNLTANPNDSSYYFFNNVVPANSGLYRVLVAPTAANIYNQYCSAISNTVFYTVNSLPLLQPSTNAPLCTGNTLQLKANASGGSGTYAAYKWTGPNNLLSQSADTNKVHVSRKDTGTYIIKVTDSKGCKNTESLFVAIDSTPVLTTLSVTDTICSGSTGKASVLSSVNTSAYYWNASLLAGTVGNIGNIINPEYSGTRSAIITNTGNIPARIKYSVYAKNNNCTSNTLDTIITIMPGTSLANAGNDTTICSNTNILLHANSPTYGSGKWKQISGPSTATLSNTQSTQPSISNLIPGLYSFEWRITGYCGSNADTVAITFIDKPIPAFSVSDTLICAGNSIILTNTTQNSALYSYSWDLGNGNYSTAVNPSAIAFNGSISGKDTSYTITLKAFTACDAISISKKIIVRSKPTIKFSVQTDNNCFPINAIFNFTSTADSTLQKIYFGDSSSNFLLHTSSINHIYQSAFNKTFYPTYVSSNNCGADSLQLSIKGFQKPTLTFTKVTDTVCAGTNAQIVVNSSIANSKFYWYSKQYTVSDSSIRNIGTSLNSSQQYAIYDSVYAISSAGCKSNSIDTVIIVLPLSNTARAGSDSIICNAINFALYANTPIHASGFWKQITGPSIISFTDSTINSTRLSGLTPGNYKFAWHIKGYCSTSADTVTINYLAKPAPSFTLSDTLICSGNTISIKNITSDIGNYGYQWNLGNGNFSSNTNLSAVTYTGSSSGKDTSYMITLKAFTNCDTIFLSKKITVRSKPIASLIATPLNLCLPLSIKFFPTTIGVESTRKILFEAGKDSLLLSDSSFTHTYFGNTNSILQPQLILTNICGADTAIQFINAIANSLQIKNNLADTTVCRIPYTASFTNNTTGANAQFWNWGDGSITNNPSQTLVHSYTKPGIYTITHCAKHVCGDTIITKTIRLNKIPHSVIQPVVNNICIGDTVLLSTDIDSSVQYKWHLNNRIIDSSAITKYVFTTPGNYTPTLYSSITANGFTCTDSTSIKIQVVGEKPGKANINPTNGFCVPFTVKLISKSLPAASVSWNMGTDSTVFGDSTLFTYTQGGDYWVKMKATNKGGCIFTDSTFISIRSPQGAVNFKSGTYCNNNFKVVFTPTVLYTDRIAWDFGDGTILETGVQNITHQYTKPGIYHPIITLISNTGCRIKLPITDSVVMENVKASFNAKTIFECGNTIFQFTDSSTSTHGIASYTWLTDSKIISTDKTASSNFYLTGTHKTELIVTGKYGCSDTVSGTYNVPIYNLPKVNINAINEACLNSLMEFKSEISSIDSVIMRLWNLGNGKTLTDSTVRILYYEQGKYAVKLTVATINKCYDSALKQITIHPVPQVKVAGPEKICAGETVELQAAGATNFVWKDQQENIICNNCLTVKVKPLRSTQYKVIGYNEFGCTQVNSTNIQVIDKIKIKVIPEDTICIGQSIHLWASGAAYYQWLPAVGLNNYTIATPTATPSATTAYRVVGKDINNCFTDTATVRVVVGNPTPLMVGKDSSFVAGSKIQLHATAATANIVRWKWAGGSDLSCVTCPNPIARVIFDECISCAATNIYGCVSKDTVCFKTFCPTTEVFLPNAFTPEGDGINDVFYVQAKGVRNIKSLRVFNRWGEVVFEKTNILPNDAGSGWNGKIRGVAANPDVYVYFCEVVCEKGGTQLYKGNVAIIR
ncbi:MAG: gliding motility-associated C-terminal domain-containing protein [Chitinophagaceae bacterium]|nr:gliding motility-associated C-terminal domain-containing protein [Chitinophagaceae bacterium]